MSVDTTRIANLRADVAALIDQITAADRERGESIAKAEGAHLVITTHLEYAESRGVVATVSSVEDIRTLYEMEAGYEAGAGDMERAEKLAAIAKSLA